MVLNPLDFLTWVLLVRDTEPLAFIAVHFGIPMAPWTLLWIHVRSRFVASSQKKTSSTITPKASCPICALAFKRCEGVVDIWRRWELQYFACISHMPCVTQHLIRSENCFCYARFEKYISLPKVYFVVETRSAALVVLQDLHCIDDSKTILKV